MSSRSDLAEMAKIIGQMMESGDAAADVVMMIAPLLADGDIVAEIVATLFAEARRKRPSDPAIHGFAAMLGLALDGLRIDAGGGDRDARRGIEAARGAVARAVAAGDPPGNVLMLVARAFAQAQLDPGPALQQATVGAMEAEARAQPAVSRQQIGEHFAEIAEACGNDPFAIYGEIASSAAAFPVEQRTAMVAMLAMSGHAAAREAALGCVVAAEPPMAEAALAAVTAPMAAAPVSSVLVERLARMRPWFTARRQAGIDAALRALRPKAEPPVALARPEIRTVLASLCDGAGAQSIFVAVKRGKRFALASVLLKLNVGVADAFVHRDLTKAECEGMIDEMFRQTDSIEVAIGFCERRIAAALAVNVARDTPPPFALLDVVETIGLGPLHPEAVEPAALAAALLAELPDAKTGDAATRAAHRALPHWRKTFATVDSWFEAGESVDALLGPIKVRKQRVHAVLHRILPARRAGWAERCAWAAAALKDAHEADPDAWIEFALVARDLASDRPLAEIPLAAVIAENTVRAFAQR